MVDLTFRMAVEADTYSVQPPQERIIQQDNRLVLINILRDEEQLCRELRNEYYDIIDDAMNFWIKPTLAVIDTPYGVEKFMKSTIMKEKPIVSADCNHVLAFASKDPNKLKYIQYEIEKKLKTRKNLQKILDGDIKTQVQLI